VAVSSFCWRATATVPPEPQNEHLRETDVTVVRQSVDSPPIPPTAVLGVSPHRWLRGDRGAAPPGDPAHPLSSFECHPRPPATAL